MMFARSIQRLIFASFLLSSFASLKAKDDPRIRFIENKNQWRAPVLYKADVANADIFLLRDRIQFLIKKESTDAGKNSVRPPDAVFEGSPHRKGSSIFSQLYEMTFVGAGKNIRVEAEDEGITSYNYFIGHDKSKWASNARGYGAVIYRDIYTGIELKVYSESGNMKQDWNVKPHANPYQIQLRYAGAESLRLENGDLIIETKAGNVTELKPYAWQAVGGSRITIPCTYRLNGNVLSYFFPEGYDNEVELVIDPILVFSGYSGSTYDNWGNSATYDSHGNLYSGGMVTQNTFGSDFPTTPGAYKTSFIGGQWDIGILKYDSAGSSLLYCTYVGGNGTESPQSLVVTKGGDLLIMGATSSTDFPVTNASVFSGGEYVDPIYGTEYFGGTDIYVARLSEDGTSLIAGTYLGGSSNDGINMISGTMASNNNVQSPLAKNYGDQTRGDVITDAGDFVYLVSTTRSQDFPVVNADPTAAYRGGPLDAVLVKLSPDLASIVWSRLLGGSGSDAAYSLKLDDSDGVYVGGGTNSIDFTGMNGLHSAIQGGVDGWVAHVSSAGDQIINATYLGTGAYDQAYFIDLNIDKEVFVFGQTQGAYPIKGLVYSNANSGQFLQKLSADLQTSLLSTVIGSGKGSPDISPTAFLVSECNTIYLSGWGGIINDPFEWNGLEFIHRDYVGGSTVGLPTTPNAYESQTTGNSFYFMVLSKDAGSFLYGTYLGGASSLTHVDGGTSRFDKRGVVYHSVCAGCGGFSDFPAVNVPAARRLNRSENCNNAAFKFDLSLLKANIQTNSVKFNNPGLNRICLHDSIAFENLSVGGQVFEWSFGDGTKLSKKDIFPIKYLYKKPGVYTVKLKAIDLGTCIGIDSTQTQVTVVKPAGTAGDDQIICQGTSSTLTASGGVTYEWTSKDGSFTSHEAKPVVSPADSMIYFIKITDNNNCVVKDTIKVGVVHGFDFQFTVTRVYDCLATPHIKVDNLTQGATGLVFDFGDGLTSGQIADVHQYAKDSTYIVKLTGQREFCSFDKEIVVPVYKILAPNVITPGEPGKNDAFRIFYGAHPITEAGINVNLTVYNRWGKDVYHSDNYRGDWSGDNLLPGVYYYEAVINGETTCKSWLQIIK